MFRNMVGGKKAKTSERASDLLFSHPRSLRKMLIHQTHDGQMPLKFSVALTERNT